MRRSIAQEIYEGEKRKITNGTLKPGDRIIESQLREEYKASNSPVREGIRLLCAAGVVEIHFNKGAVVTDYSDERRISEAFEARYVIESYCAKLLSERGDPEELRLLESIVDDMERIVSKENLTFPEEMEGDERFHSTLVKLSGNRELCNMFSSMFLFAKCSFNVLYLSERVYDPSWAHTTAANHRAILEAIKNKDYSSLQNGLSEHLGMSASQIGVQILINK